MGRPPSNKPTDAEMEILRIVWERGQVTVRDVHDVFIATGRPSSYTAIATTVRTMVDKGTIQLVDSRRPQKFAAVSSEQTTYSSIAQDVTRRVFGDSVARFLQFALTGRRHSAQEIEELRNLIEQFDTDAAKPAEDAKDKPKPKRR